MNLTAQVESVFATVISDNPMKTQLVWFHLLTLTAEYSNWKTCIHFSYIKIGCYCISEQNAQLKAMLRLRVEMLLSDTSLWVWAGIKVGEMDTWAISLKIVFQTKGLVKIILEAVCFLTEVMGKSLWRMGSRAQEDGVNSRDTSFRETREKKVSGEFHRDAGR